MSKRPKIDRNGLSKDFSVKGENTNVLEKKLDAISDSNHELKKALIEYSVEQVKPIDESFNKQNEQLADEFDVMIEEAIRKGKLEDFLAMMDNSIGTNFDDYMIIEQPLEVGVERYLKNAELIKRLVKVRNDNGLPTNLFGMLNDDIGYFGKKLLEKLGRSDFPQKDEIMAKIEEMIKN